MTTVLLIVAAFLFCAYREWLWSIERKQWKEERKDLYSRIMAKDLTEYREEKKPFTSPKAPQSKFISVLKKQNSPMKGGE